jgi:hypothetical protein
MARNNGPAVSASCDPCNNDAEMGSSRVTAEVTERSKERRSMEDVPRTHSRPNASQYSNSFSATNSSARSSFGKPSAPWNCSPYKQSYCTANWLNDVNSVPTQAVHFITLRSLEGLSTATRSCGEHNHKNRTAHGRQGSEQVQQQQQQVHTCSFPVHSIWRTKAAGNVLHKSSFTMATSALWQNSSCDTCQHTSRSMIM